MTDCSICLEIITDDLYTTVCGHSFHKSCSEQLKASGHYKCPMCRKVIFEVVPLFTIPRFNVVRQIMIIAASYQNQTNYHVIEIPIVPQEDEELELNRITAERVIAVLFEDEE